MYFYGEYEVIMMENDWKWIWKNYEYPQGRKITEKNTRTGYKNKY